MKPLRFLTALWTLLLLTGCGDSAATAEEDLPCRTEVMAMDTIMNVSYTHVTLPTKRRGYGLVGEAALRKRWRV